MILAKRPRSDSVSWLLPYLYTIWNSTAKIQKEPVPWRRHIKYLRPCTKRNRIMGTAGTNLRQECTHFLCYIVIVTDTKAIIGQWRSCTFCNCALATSFSRRTIILCMHFILRVMSCTQISMPIFSDIESTTEILEYYFQLKFSPLSRGPIRSGRSIRRYEPALSNGTNFISIGCVFVEIWVKIEKQ